MSLLTLDETTLADAGRTGAAVALAPEVSADAAPVAVAGDARPIAMPAMGLWPQSMARRVFYGALALALTLGFSVCVYRFHTASDAGVDQNGYLVGGKQIAQTLSMAIRPVQPGTETGTDGEGGPVGKFDPHQYVGNMWVGADEGMPDERFYPKYPMGYPLLVSTALWAAAPFPNGFALGRTLAYWINPLALVLSVVATYRLSRRFMGGYGSFLAATIYAISPMTLLLSETNNSHATATFCAAWGMERLFAWWGCAGQRGGLRRAIVAGLLLGYAATIRYSEATLILPIGLVALFSLRPRDRESWRQALAVGIAWLVPVAVLAAYNLSSMGTLTGYDPTNESTGFAWANAADNWETMIRQLNTNGLSMLLPLSLAGLGLMFKRNWKASAVLAAWIVPCLITYTFYYWAPDTTSIAYLRFFQTILPGLSMTAVWFVTQAASADHLKPIIDASDRSLRARLARLWHAGPIAPALIALIVGVVIAITAGEALRRASLEALDSPTVAGLAFEPIVAPARWAGAAATGAGVALLAMALLRPGRWLNAVGAAVLLGVSLAMQAQTAAAQLEMGFVPRLNLTRSVAEVRAAVPDGSTVFCQNNPMLNDLQFAGDYAIYDGNTFDRGWVQGLNNTPSADQPNALDFKRRHSLFVRLGNLDARQLLAQARQVIDGSLAAGRPVFFIVQRRENEASLGQNIFWRAPARGGGRANARAGGGGGAASPRVNAVPDLLRRLITPEDYDAKVVRYWSDAVNHAGGPGGPGGPFGGPFGGPRPRGARLAAPFGMAGPDRHQSWEIIEVMKRAAEGK